MRDSTCRVGQGGVLWRSLRACSRPGLARLVRRLALASAIVALQELWCLLGFPVGPQAGVSWPAYAQGSGTVTEGADQVEVGVTSRSAGAGRTGAHAKGGASGGATPCKWQPLSPAAVVAFGLAGQVSGSDGRWYAVVCDEPSELPTPGPGVYRVLGADTFFDVVFVAGGGRQESSSSSTRWVLVERAESELRLPSPALGVLPSLATVRAPVEFVMPTPLPPAVSTSVSAGDAWLRVTAAPTSAFVEAGDGARIPCALARQGGGLGVAGCYHSYAFLPDGPPVYEPTLVVVWSLSCSSNVGLEGPLPLMTTSARAAVPIREIVSVLEYAS
jgi:hypothetical protein